MRNLLRKEIRLGSSPLSLYFTLFSLMFLIPGYPILCGAFFITLGLFQSFQYTRESNDIIYTVLLPVAKKDAVISKFLFVVFIEALGFLGMSICTVLRMTVLSDTQVYVSNALMSANLFALAMALVIFCLFNFIFVRLFYKTAYSFTKPFIVYAVSCFVTLILAEALHFLPSLEVLNSTKVGSVQLLCLTSALVLYVLVTLLSIRLSCRSFEEVDL